MAPLIKQVQLSERNNWLDVVRGLAIFGVVSVHSIQLTDNILLTNTSYFFTLFASLGRYGVEVFFFLSGWLLATIYGLSGEPLGKSYLARRVGKIYPLWISFMLFNLLRWKFTDSGNINSVTNDKSLLHSTAVVIILTLTFSLFVSDSLWNNVIPGGWSIQAEIAHYLLFPLIRNRSLNSILKIAVLINFTTSILYILRLNMNYFPPLFLQILDAWFRLGLYSTFGYFLIGILSYLSYIKIKESKGINLNFNHLNISPNVFIVFCLSLLVIPCPFGNQFEAIGYLGITILVSLGILRNKKISSFFQFLGRYSYFIYFGHFVALMSASWVIQRTTIIESESTSQQVIFAFIFVYTLTISSLLAIPSMKYFEKPIIRMAHKV